MGWWDNDVEIGVLLGETVKEIRGKEGGDSLDFICESGLHIQMWHRQDCCENVYLEDVAGDLADLVGSPILQAEEVSGEEPSTEGRYVDSETWTFYKLATSKGYVTLRWLGESNGYYSEEVDITRIAPRDDADDTQDSDSRGKGGAR